MSEYYGGQDLTVERLREMAAAREARQSAIEAEQEAAAQRLRDQASRTRRRSESSRPSRDSARVRHLKQGRWLGVAWPGKEEVTFTPGSERDPYHFQGGALVRTKDGTTLTLAYNHGTGPWRRRGSREGRVESLSEANRNLGATTPTRRPNPHAGKVGVIGGDAIARIVNTVAGR